jgi:hypothetical protein
MGRSRSRPDRTRRTAAVDVRIGVTYTPKEIEVELADDVAPDDVARIVEEALSADNGVLWLTDRRGRRVGVPAPKVAFVEIGSPSEDRRVGFGAHGVR